VLLVPAKLSLYRSAVSRSVLLIRICDLSS